MSYKAQTLVIDMYEDEIKNYIHQVWESSDPSWFPGPQPISIERKHFRVLKSQPYVVCEKTDGVRHMLVCFEASDKKKICALVDRAFHVTFTTLTVPRDTVLDGELMDSIFYVYDAVRVKGEDVRNKTLTERLTQAKVVVKSILKQPKLQVKVKVMLPLSEVSKIHLGEKTVDGVRSELIGKIGENLSIRRFQLFSGSNQLVSYLHGTRIGVMVEFVGDEVAAKDVAMHIAAMKPVALSTAQVPAEKIAIERSVAEQKAAESGKPPEIVAKMVDGSIQKYLKEVSLLNQTFVKNDKQTVEQMLKQQQTTIHSFTMYIVGEGIEKRQDDFAAEVAAQVAAAKGTA